MDALRRESQLSFDSKTKNEKTTDFHIRMKISSSTQTEEQSSSQVALTELLEEAIEKTDGVAQTDLSEVRTPDEVALELEVQRLIEHHEIETSRLQGNIDFWKEKVDGLIKQHKEMLENKTKLHLQLEQSDLAL